MKFEIFSVYDAKAEQFNTPMFLPKKGQAIRAFADQVKDPASELAKHPEDYTLFCLGSYESDDGKFEPGTSPVALCSALDFKED